MANGVTGRVTPIQETRPFNVPPNDVEPASQLSEHEDNTSMLSQPAPTLPNERPSLQTNGQELSLATEHDTDNNHEVVDNEATPLLEQTDENATNADDQRDLPSDQDGSINLSISSLSSSEQREDHNPHQQRVLNCKRCLYATLVVSLILLIISCVPLVVDIILSIKHRGEDLAVRNDFIYLRANSSGLLYDKVIFFQRNATADDLAINMTTNIYQFPCKEMYLLYISYDKPLKSSRPKVQQAIELSFNSCSLYVNKCILDVYWYSTKSTVAFIAYNITLSQAPPNVITRVLAFDDVISYTNFLKGQNNYKTIKAMKVKSKNWKFVFSSADMVKEASYYFFVIEKVEGLATSFTIAKDELRTFFNASKLFPACRLEGSSSCVLNTMSSSDDSLDTMSSCFLAQAQGRKLLTVPGPQDQVYVVYKTNFLPLTVLGILSLSAFTLVLLFVFFVLAICIYLRLKYRNNIHDIAENNNYMQRAAHM